MNFFNEAYKLVKTEKIYVDFNCHSFVLGMIKSLSKPTEEQDGDIARSELVDLLKNNPRNQILESEVLQKLKDHMVTYHIYHSGMIVHSGLVAPIEFQNTNIIIPDQLYVLERESSTYSARRNLEYSSNVAVTSYANSVKDYYRGVNPSTVSVKFYAWSTN